MFLNSKKNIDSTDLELLEKYKTSDNNYYFGILFQRYTHLVYGVCMKYLKNTEESKDAVMSIFEYCLPIVKKHQISNFKSWLYVVAKNYCLIQIRKEKSNALKFNEFENYLLHSMENDENLHLSDRNDDLESFELKNMIKELKNEQKKCLELFYVENKSYKEITEITGYTVNEVKTFLQNGKRNLKILLTSKQL